MSRASGLVGAIFALALALVIALAGPLLLFNPWFTSLLQERHGVTERLGVSAGEVDRMTDEILGDIYAFGDFNVALEGGEPLLNQRERAHMQDVSRLVRLLWFVLGVAAAAIALASVALVGERRRVGRLMLVGAALVGGTGLALGLVFAVAFESAFLAFHAVFFPPDTYLFPADSRLIALFPGGFWFDATLAAGASVVLTAFAVAFAGLRLARTPPAVPPGASVA